MTKDELIDLEVKFTDEWYKEHTGVPTYADAIEWEHKRMIAKARMWLAMNMTDIQYVGIYGDIYKPEFIHKFITEIEE